MTEPSGTSPIIIPLITAGSGLLGVYVGGLWGDRREHNKQKADFIRAQLSEFYGPLVSLRAEIKARSELRTKISNAADNTWRDLVAEADRAGIAEKQRLSKERGPAFSAIIDDDNKTFRETLIPAYQQMMVIFREKMWLAEPETRKYFSDFIEFLEIWERVLRKALPGEVIGELGHTEENLHPFYTHLEATHDRLRLSLTEGTSSILSLICMCVKHHLAGLNAKCSQYVQRRSA